MKNSQSSGILQSAACVDAFKPFAENQQFRHASEVKRLRYERIGKGGRSFNSS